VSLVTHAPHIDGEAACRLTREVYGLDATAEALPSERDQNFLLTSATGDRFVLKIANALEDRALLDAQNQAMAAVSATDAIVPLVLPTRTGECIAAREIAPGTRWFVRLLSYLPGVPLAQVKRQSPALLRDLGRVVARVDRALAHFDHPAIHREFYWDLAAGRKTSAPLVGRIADATTRSVVERLLADFDVHTAPLLARLRTSVVHNDANDYNVIVSAPDPVTRERRVVGLIDFGDMVHSYSVASLAVAIAYAVLDKPDPLAVAGHVIAGYHAERPLRENEVTALFGLICLRLCMSARIAADQMASRPNDPYLAISQEPLARTLPVLAGTHPRFAEYTFRAACGFEPVPGEKAVTNWLRANAATFASVLGPVLGSPGDYQRAAPPIVLDLSVGSPLVAGNPTDNTEPKLSARIATAMAEAGASVAIGRYGEARLLYTSPIFADAMDLNYRRALRAHSGPGAEAQPRTVHLGIDLFAAAGTPVFAPLGGVVHTFANNGAPLDYGPVVVLEHTIDETVHFYTVYGHLARASLDGLHAGKKVSRGELIGTIGTPDINGGWPPHLHFQLVTDVLDRGTDFPGVAPAPQRSVWESLSPDPSALRTTSATRSAGASQEVARGISSRIETTLAARRARIGRNLSVAYAEPVKVARGWMQYLYDDDGRRYLDAYNNVPHVGHAHPAVVRAACDQMRVLNTNTRYLHDGLAAFGETLTATLPPSLSVCFFVNSGSEANELALRLARAHTRGRDVISLDAAYHGITTTLIDISPYKHHGPGGQGAPPWAHAVPLPDTYRGAYRRSDPDAGVKYAQHVEETCERIRQQGGALSAFIAESCPSVGGQLMLPDGYLAAAYRHVRRAGGVCIADEVQTAYGRIGTHFWGFETQDVVPDIVVLGKPIGNGYPIGAVVTTREIAASFDNGMEFFSTFGGSTVACAVGRAVLEVVLREGLQEHARRIGARMLSRLRALADRYPIVGDVRGSGLFLGVELVRDRQSLAPAGNEAAFVVNRLREEGILTGTDGPFHNVIKIRPPMPFGGEDGDRLVAALDRILGEEFSSTPPASAAAL
jgi:4-aminobutyrate aminotransferase-like enzyme/Ser/Thr protein kinase RdoA (MazF antagonist)/murein DD-endopeptidase MepM/ murein hydrolase activator NlpD